MPWNVEHLADRNLHRDRRGAEALADELKLK
jgi:hypothetical protein